ncbi:hypothetical protein [Halobacteriovorax marinus]|uniref:hypothetical protein n=1 Tax=Halobacteriovorax marinus TaxID=97084 RepID=UPI003A933D5D
MKYLVTLLILFSANTMATRFEIINSCKSTPIFSTVVTDSYQSVGELSLNVLAQNNIPTLASDYGISQIYNSPIGLDAMEVLSDTMMRSHGWCYSVDGMLPEVLMNEFTLTGSEKVIAWFMGYSTYIGNPMTGEAIWEGQCIPSYSLETAPFPDQCN